MKYDFDTVYNRRGTGSLKWGVGENELPMWVADMDFKTSPDVIGAISARAGQGIYGYAVIPDEWSEAICGWWRRRHGFDMKPEWLIFCTGVVPAISSAVRKLTKPGDFVVVQTPVYNIFFNSVVNNDRTVLENPLKYDGESYSMDFNDLESKLANPRTTLMILCNPQNPAGRIWEKETLAKVGELCERYGVTVISDEIHCDVTEPGIGYVPFASVSETCRRISVSCISPTKAFNIAGIKTAAVVVSDAGLRGRIDRALNTDEVAEPNVFATVAATAAFSHGDEWLDELCEYISVNKRTVDEYLAHNLPQIKAVRSTATYLVWLDCGEITDNTDGLTHFIREKTGLFLTAGGQYGGNGAEFIRMNVACPRSTLRDGLARFGNGVSQYLKSINK